MDGPSCMDGLEHSANKFTEDLMVEAHRVANRRHFDGVSRTLSNYYHIIGILITGRLISSNLTEYCAGAGIL